MGDVENKFLKMGARAEILADPLATLRIDIRRDGDGEYFELRHGTGTQLQVLDVRPGDAHLLLMARQGGVKSKFLCGHDERAWFVAAVPESARAKDVQGAKDALKPPEVWEAIRRFRVPAGKRDRRRTAGFVRQGEWFFLPRPELTVDGKLVLADEPIRRGAGKPHVCQFVFRRGGEAVHVCPLYPNGLSEREFRQVPENRRKAQTWRVMVRDAHVFAKGTVRHPDHQTIRLAYWHEVVMNTETRARAMRGVAFLD